MPPVDIGLPAWARSAISAGVVLFTALVAHRLITRAIGRYARRHADRDSRAPHDVGTRAKTIVTALRPAATACLWVVAVLIAINQGGIDIGPLLAAFGIIGVAIGLGGQHFTKDLIAGVAIVLEDQYRVGDVISVNGVSGRVEKITLSSSTVRDVHGVSHVISNGDIRTSSNMTKGFSRYVIDIPVPYEENVDSVIEVAREQLDRCARNADTRTTSADLSSSSVSIPTRRRA